MGRFTSYLSKERCLEVFQYKTQVITQFFEEFIFFFDNRSADDEYYHFREVFKQRDAQDFDSWILIFEEKIQQMQSIKQYPDYDDENFKETFMRDLYCKLNKQCFTIVTKKLKDLQLEAKNCNWRDFKRWIEESKYQEKNLLAFSENQKPPRHEKPTNNSQT